MMGATLIIACGALAREIDALKRANGWDRLQVQCLDASLHNRPKAIPARVDALLEKHFHQYERVFERTLTVALAAHWIKFWRDGVSAVSPALTVMKSSRRHPCSMP